MKLKIVLLALFVNLPACGDDGSAPAPDPDKQLEEANQETQGVGTSPSGE
jgi:hypothetical protein